MIEMIKTVVAELTPQGYSHTVERPDSLIEIGITSSSGRYRGTYLSPDDLEGMKDAEGFVRGKIKELVKSVRKGSAEGSERDAGESDD